MRIDCPHCGARDQGEFSYLGDATIKRPGADASDEAHFSYVYMRDNPAGVHREWWYHGFGCRSWIAVTRDTRTHEIVGVQAASAAGEVKA